MKCMKSEECYPANMAGEETKVGTQHRDYGFIIFAGFLIGLGVGLLVDHVVSAVLIGLGVGFLASGLIPLVRKPMDAGSLHTGGINVTGLLIGAFLIFIAIGIVYAPAALWPYAIAGFLILVGIWSLIRGFSTIA